MAPAFRVPSATRSGQAARAGGLGFGAHLALPRQWEFCDPGGDFALCLFMDQTHHCPAPAPASSPRSPATSAKAISPADHAKVPAKVYTCPDHHAAEMDRLFARLPQVLAPRRCCPNGHGRAPRPLQTAHFADHAGQRRPPIFPCRHRGHRLVGAACAMRQALRLPLPRLDLQGGRPPARAPRPKPSPASTGRPPSSNCRASGGRPHLVRRAARPISPTP